MFTKKTIRDIDYDGKRVLLRADYNVPLSDDGIITGPYRIEQSVDTLKQLLAGQARLIVCSHLGRPDGKVDPKYSLRPIATKLTELLGQEVRFVSDCIGEEVDKAVNELTPGQILLLENLRFHPEEEANDDQFAARLASNADFFVQDGFGVVHRAHASTDAITRHLPSVAGPLLEKEVDTITKVMTDPNRPLMAIIGGAKIADKIHVINKFIEIADFVVIGGAMANTFLKVKGIDIGKSQYDPDDMALARDILDRAETKARNGNFTFYLPQDGVVATTLDKNVQTRIVDWDAHVIADIENYPHVPSQRTRQVEPEERILDLGPFSGAFCAGGAQLAGTIIWNGTLGVTEVPALTGPIGPFAHGTELVIEALIGDWGHKPFTLVGGGDTVSYIEQRQLISAFNHVSTGGGACLELIAGRPLPGVDSLQNKS